MLHYFIVPLYQYCTCSYCATNVELFECCTILMTHYMILHHFDIELFDVALFNVTLFDAALY